MSAYACMHISQKTRNPPSQGIENPEGPAGPFNQPQKTNPYFHLISDFFFRFNIYNTEKDKYIILNLLPHNSNFLGDEKQYLQIV